MAFSKAEDKLKGLNIKISDLETAIDEANGQIATLADEIAALEAGIKALDKEVADATEMRQKEHAENTETVANDRAAKEVIGIAKNRLAKFYTPKLYKAAPKTELSAENRVVVSMGGTVAPTPAPGGIAGTGVVAFVQVKAHDNRVAPAPPPETWDAYTKKGEEHTGVVEMINMLKADLAKEMQETEVNEKEGQAEYETFMAESAAKRAADTKSIAEKEAAKADLGAEVEQLTAENGATMKEAMATAESIKDLHLDCDWLIANFQARKDARAGEVESLKNAKAVLSGADYSFLQTGARRNLRGAAPEDELAKEMTHDLEMNFNKIAPFGKEDTAKELQDHAAKTQDTLVDAVENAEVAEIKRAVFRALTRLRAATIKEFDTIARLETQAIDAYNDNHHYRRENPLDYIHSSEVAVK